MQNKKITLIILLLISRLILQAQKLPDKELRGVWVSTAFNIDWPSSTKISSYEQQQEFIKLIETHKGNGINAVFVQIRPSGEVFYKSDIEPWSHWLTGTQGKAPEPFYDPLKFMIEECHKRKIELHAWFNPFRTVSNIARVKTVPWHITKQKPEWFITYGGDVVKKYLNPGIPAARNYIIKVIMEVVKKYDIDGVHFDDYFYPVRQGGRDFSDHSSYLQYNSLGLNKADWRRENINTFIHDLSDSINTAKPQVKFGIGPSGIWRNKKDDPEGSDTKGLSSYDQQYADVLKWLREGWIDYVAPQIYWVIGYRIADYAKLVDWWSRHVYGKHLYIGHGTHRINTNGSWRNPSEIPNQIRLNRKYPQVKGSIFYSSTALLLNKNGVTDSLRNNFFFAYADIPEMKWKISPVEPVPTITKPEKPKVKPKIKKLPIPEAPINLIAEKVSRETFIQWEMPASQKSFVKDTASRYNIYRYRGDFVGYITKENLYATTKETSIMIPRRGLFKKKFTFVITAVNSQKKESQESEAIIVKMRK